MPRGKQRNLSQNVLYNSTFCDKYRFRLLVVVVGIIALVLRLWIPGPTNETYDENLWIHRSDSFSHAIVHLNLAQASAGDPSLKLVNPTMPGVTTMWAGVIGRQIARTSGALGLSEPIRGPSFESPQALRAAQGVIAFLCAALLVLLMFLLAKLFSRRVALMTGALLATEPWLVGLGQMLHTDALVMLFSITSLCAFAWALARNAQDVQPSVHTPWLVGASMLATLALLTKTNAIGIVGPGAALIAVSAWRKSFRTCPKVLTKPFLWGAGSGVVVTVLLWPALVAAPIQQVRLLFDATKQVGKTRERFYLGSLRGFIPQFYVVALAFRLTIWMLAWCAFGWIGGTWYWVRHRLTNRKRKFAATKAVVPMWILLTPLPYFFVLSASRFGYDRYATAILPFGVIAGALVVAHVLPRIGALRSRTPAQLGAIGLAILALLAIAPIRHAPFNLEYVNALGMKRAVRWIPIESGQTSSHMDAKLRDLVEGNCKGLRVANAYPHPAVESCGTSFAPATIRELRTADFAFTFQVGKQPSAREWFEPWLVEHATLIDTLDIGGVTFARLWRLDT